MTEAQKFTDVADCFEDQSAADKWLIGLKNTIPMPVATTDWATFCAAFVARFKGADPVLKPRDHHKGSSTSNIVFAHLVAAANINFLFEDLIDDPPPLPLTIATPTLGYHKYDILDQLTIVCHTQSTGKAWICCTGDGCHESWATPQMSGSILPHASACQYLPADIKNLALMSRLDKIYRSNAYLSARDLSAG
ncbi:hypothetical protein B0H10DRAFT_1956962 [Mycena sp. CBHHK59/15]|nr:hypothetical protein B0H10DRAFT_1956962 [Mycena sp. CBHHK59/15]